MIIIKSDLLFRRKQFFLRCYQSLLWVVSRCFRKLLLFSLEVWSVQTFYHDNILKHSQPFLDLKKNTKHTSCPLVEVKRINVYFTKQGGLKPYLPVSSISPGWCLEAMVSLSLMFLGHPSQTICQRFLMMVNPNDQFLAASQHHHGKWWIMQRKMRNKLRLAVLTMEGSTEKWLSKWWNSECPDGSLPTHKSGFLTNS